MPCPPSLESGLPPCMPACAATTHTPASRPAPRMCPPFDSAGRMGVQPAAELRHGQGHGWGGDALHGHALHVSGAPRTCPGPRALSRTFPVHMPLAPPPPRSRLLARRLAPHRMPLLSTRQYTRAFNQPLSFDTAKVTDMGGMFYVRALTPAQPSAGRRACRLRRHAAPQPPPASRVARIACGLLFDSAVRDGVQPAAELGHVQRHGHGRHVLRALRARALASKPSVGPRVCTPSARAHTHPPPSSRHAPRPPSYALPLSTRGRAHPCPTPTSCSSVARGRAPRPSPPLAIMNRAGGREAARRPRRPRPLARDDSRRQGDGGQRPWIV